MTEASQVENSENGLLCTFNITPKTTLEQLKAHTHSSYDLAEKATEDIFANAKELEPGVNWNDILDTISWINNGRRFTRLAAIHQSVAPTIASIARIMGWNMDDPAIVYMSAQAFLQPLSKRANYLDQDIKAIDNGSHKFPTEEAKAKKYEEETNEVSKLGMFRKRISETAEDYADQFLPKDDKYKEALKMLLMTGHQSTGAQRNSAVICLKNGNIEKAHQILSRIKFVDKRIYQ